MIDEVFTDNTTFNKVPNKFEAGTPDIAGVIGLKEAIRYLQKIGLGAIYKHETELSSYAIKSFSDAFDDSVYILGGQSHLPRIGVVAFTLKGCHPHDVAGMLGEENICIRAGHHCAMPLHTRLQLNASNRASFYLYNDKTDVDRLIKSLVNIKKTLS